MTTTMAALAQAAAGPVSGPPVINAKCVGCGVLGSLDTIIQHASACKITVVVEGNKGSQIQTSDAQTVSCQDLPWVPPSFSLLKRDGGYVSGIVNTEEELGTLLANHKRATLSSYTQWSSNERKLSLDPSKLRVMWQVEDYCEDTPLSVTKRVIMNCQHGKEYAASTAKEDSLEHVYTRKRRSCEKRVKKLDCPAKVFIRHVKRYDTFSVKGNASRFRKEETMKKLKIEMAKTTPPTSTFIHVKLPLVEAHQNHPMDSGCGQSKRKRSKGKDKTLETAEPITQQQGAQPPQDKPSSTPLHHEETALPEPDTTQRPKAVTLCPLCFKPYLTMASHLRKAHKVANKEERALLLDLAAKRVDIRDAACPVAGCTYKSDRLYTHLLVEAHADALSKEEAESLMDTVRKERTVSLLAALRTTNPCPPMATTIDLQTPWACMGGEEQLVEEAFIPGYGEWEEPPCDDAESEEDPACADAECAKRLERCREANEKLALSNRRLEEQLAELKAKHKHLERKHRSLCEAAGVPMLEAGACGRGRKAAVKKRRAAGPEEERHGQVGRLR